MRTARPPHRRTSSSACSQPAAAGRRTGETPDELSRDLFETAVRLDNGNVAAKFDLELAVRRLRAVGARTGAGQGSGPRGGGRRGAGAGLPGRGY